MPASDILSKAKAALGKANRDFPDLPAKAVAPNRATNVAAASAPKTSPAKSGIGDNLYQGVGQSLEWNAEQAKSVPKMHKGGVIPKDGIYNMKKGEVVIPTKAKKSSGRQSEYRKVFVARQQTRQGGGNSPVKGEAHGKAKGDSLPKGK